MVKIYNFLILVIKSIWCGIRWIVYGFLCIFKAFCFILRSCFGLCKDVLFSIEETVHPKEISIKTIALYFLYLIFCLLFKITNLFYKISKLLYSANDIIMYYVRPIKLENKI